MSIYLYLSIYLSIYMYIFTRVDLQSCLLSDKLTLLLPESLKWFQKRGAAMGDVAATEGKVGFRVQGLRSRVWGLGFRAYDRFPDGSAGHRFKG